MREYRSSILCISGCLWQNREGLQVCSEIPAEKGDGSLLLSALTSVHVEGIQVPAGCLPMDHTGYLDYKSSTSPDSTYVLSKKTRQGPK